MSIGADGAEYCVKYWRIGAGVSIEYRFHTNPAGKPVIVRLDVLANCTSTSGVGVAAAAAAARARACAVGGHGGAAAARAHGV